MKLIIVSGLSGSGKSITLHTLEDLNYYCIDNLPVDLLQAFARQMTDGGEQAYENAAVGIDARNRADALRRFPEILSAIKASGLTCELLYLQAEDDTLFKRYSETRRKHPLTGKDRPLAEAIRLERELLEPFAAHADLIFDSTRTNIHQLRALVRDRVEQRRDRTLSLLFLSFGYKHGIPPDADFVFDLRCLPNPHWEAALRPLTGLDENVIDFLQRQPKVVDMLEHLRSFLDSWIPCFEAENRSYMTVALGCTGGQHRSVYLVEMLAAYFRKTRDSVLIRHRELS
ncbi:MAG: RNase adapter RapZ [Gammaproteobacteria bacterium]